ncbi:MAG: LacI family transcriptional regulator [Lachnospiraceae bacterium]|jgi:DNA-binding LacI/PurR family transcriptional regulator|nr:LacI family transcriptional regulator [Lachnospiraceae bacterium]
MASYKDLVKLTGLSLGTISNVVQGKGNVKPENKEKVLKAMEDLGYRVDYQARSLASDRTNLIGLVVSDIENVAETKFMMPMETFAEKNNCRIITATSRNDSEREKRNCESMLSSKVDGLFIFFESLANEAYFRMLAKTEKTPIIFLARYLEGCDLPYVGVDNFFAAKCMVDFVYNRGHRNITYLDIIEGAMLSPNRDRRNSVEAECKARGMGFQLFEYPTQNDDVAVGYDAAESLIRAGKLPKMVFPRDDSFAVGFYNACIKHGVRVPEDVSIMGFGDFYSSRMTPKRISTFDRKFDQVIEAATELYLKIRAARRNGEDESNLKKKVFIKGCVIEGETVAIVDKKC